MKHTTETIIEKFISIHGDKYDYSKVIYLSYGRKVEIVCKTHGSFWQIPGHHIGRKQGCPDCYGNKRGDTKSFVEKSIVKHGETYNYSLVKYKSSTEKVEIICPKHGPFWQTPANHLQGQGCIKCAGVSKPTDDEFIEKANIVHKGEYTYPRLGYLNVSSKITITCKEHGDFTQIANAHLCGAGCSKCNGGVRYNYKSFVAISNDVHEFKYSYDKAVYKNKDTKVIITCKEHGDFTQTPGSHMQGNGCKSCADYGFNPSKPAIFYLISIGDDILGFGVTNSFDSRYRTHRKNFKKHAVSHDLLQTYDCSGHQALAIEHHLKQTYEIIDTGIEGFRREATEIKYLPDILKYINNLLDTI